MEISWGQRLFLYFSTLFSTTFLTTLGFCKKEFCNYGFHIFGGKMCAHNSAYFNDKYKRKH